MHRSVTWHATLLKVCVHKCSLCWSKYGKHFRMRFSPDMFCHISVIKDDCCIVVYACSFLPDHLQCEWLGKPKIGAGSPLHCWCCDYSCLNEFLCWHFPHFVFSLNKCVHSDAQFYRTNGCWWLFELNSVKVRACKCSIMHIIYYVSTYVCSCLKIIYEKQNDFTWQKHYSLYFFL